MVKGREPENKKKRKRCKKIRRYLEKWESEPGLHWLSPHESKSNLARCRECNKILQAEHYILVNHAKSRHGYDDEKLVAVPAVKKKKLQADFDGTPNDEASIAIDQPCCKEDVIRVCKEEDSKYEDVVRFSSVQDPKDDQTDSKEEAREFRPWWLKDPKYHSWCRPVPHNNALALCIKCRHTMAANVWYLNDHMSTPYHKFHANSTSVLGRAFYPESAALEIKCSAVIGDANFSHLGSEKLFQFFQNSVKDSVSLSNAELNRRRTLAIQKNVIAPAHQEKLAQILKESKFAIEIDEATDVSTDHAMCIVVRYYDPTRKRVCDSLWDLKPLYFGDEKSTANAQTIFDNICASFAEWDIPLENIFAFCSDTCSVMMGKNNSVAALLKQIIPGILIVKCDCHIEHLCAKDAMKKIPLDNFSSVVYNYMNSSKKKHMWEVCQTKLNLNPLQVLKPICIRWLSHYQCILRLLRRWRALIVFFENEVIESKDPKGTAAEILRCLRDPVNKAYHMFVEAQLSKLVQTNEVLQSEKPIVPKTMSAMQQVYIKMLSMYMNEDYVKKTALRNIDPTNEAEFRKLEDINVGFHTRQYMKSAAIFNVDVEKEFKITCRNFYIETCSKMRRRCNFRTNDSFIGKYFNVENALDQHFHDLHPNLNEAIVACPSLLEPNSDISNAINVEWNHLLNYDLPDGIMNERNIDTFWVMVKEVQEQGEFLFENLAKFALQVLCIPNSNAAPERVWSKFNLGKTSIRNRLDISSIRAMLLTAQYVHDGGGINLFQPTEAMVNRMKRPLGVRVPNLKPSFPTFKLNGSEAKIYYGKLKFEVEVAEECNLEDRTYKFSYTDANLVEDLTPHMKDVTIVQDLKRKHSGDDTDDFESAMKKLKIDENDRRRWIIYGHDHQYLQKDVELACIEGNKSGTNKQSKTNKHKKPPTYPNGLLSNAEIYKQVMKDHAIAIGRYSSIPNHPIRDHRLWDSNKSDKRELGTDHEFKLYSNEFRTLFETGDAGFIDGDVMDAFFAIKERKWKNTVYCPVNMSNIICNTWDEDVPNEEWAMFHVTPDFKGKVLFPNTRGLHWRLACADFGKKEFWQLDPMSIEKANTYKNDLRHFGIVLQNEEEMRTAAQICFDNFMKFCHRSNQLHLPNAFSRISWTLTSKSSPRTLQTDGYNCGIHIMQYADRIGRNLPLMDKNKFNPENYRSLAINLLLENSENMALTCLFCFEGSNFARRCDDCNRGMHQECLNIARLNMVGKCILCTSSVSLQDKNTKGISNEPLTTCVSTELNAVESQFANMITDAAEKPLTCSGKTKSTKLTTYINGLPSDLQKFRYIKQQIAIGCYTSIDDHPIRDYRPCVEGQVRAFGLNKKFLLFSKEFQKLFGTGEAGYIDGELVDAFCAIRERTWKNVYCCPVNLSSMIFATWGERPIDEEWTMFHIKANFTGKILFPFSLHSHWYLFVVDVHKKTAWLLDPQSMEAEGIYKDDLRNIGIAPRKDERTNAQRCFDNFMEYCKRSKNSQLNTFNKTSWKLTSNASPRALQQDSYNCGIIMLHYADRIGRGVPLMLKTFDPTRYRSWVGKLLLENSDSMLSICLFCFSEREREKTKCSECDRIMHIRCLENRNLPISGPCILCSSSENNFLNPCTIAP